MRRSCLLLAFALSLCWIFGCFSDADKKQWNEAFKDARGDNMEMRYGKSTSSQP